METGLIIGVIGVIGIILMAYLIQYATMPEPLPTICLGMNITEAIVIAEASSCMDNGSALDIDDYFCNNVTATWWIDLNVPDSPDYCNPACVIDISNGSAEINWRCTGLIE